MSTRILRPVGLLAVVVVSLGLAACGSSGSKSAGNQTDRAFVNDMTPHHQMAIQMAQIAQQRAQHPELKTLAGAIVADQKSEIAQMGTLKTQIQAGDGKSTFGMSMAAMGMDMNMGALAKANPFDRSFIDDMVPHHTGAVMMAKMELAKGTNPQARALAQRIITAQQKEIGQMNTWRTSWYGAPVPAGAVHGGHAMHPMPGM